MLGNRLLRTGVTLMLAVMMAGLPALLVGPSSAGDDGWAQFMMEDHVVLHANEECVVDDDGNTENCYNQGSRSDDDDGESCGFWCWVGRFAGSIGLACRYFPNFFLCG